MLYVFCYFELYYGYINVVLWVCCYCVLCVFKVYGYVIGVCVLCVLLKFFCIDKRNFNMIFLNLKFEIEM